jgi:predicted porin
MKKSLLAVAAMGAFAGAAQAQSSVTVYGILDLGYVGQNTRLGTGSSAQPSNWTQSSAFGQSAETTSRLGFRGTEDLGGGMNAFFTVELELNPASSNLSGGTAVDAFQGTSQNAGSTLNNRQTFLGLSKKGTGQFAFGRQYTPVFVAGQQTSPGQYNNIIGDVVYAGGASGTLSAAAGNANGNAFTNRASNALTVQSERMGGLVLSGMYAMNNTDTTMSSQTAGGTKDFKAWGLGANFVIEKLLVTAAYQSFNKYNQFSTATTSAVLAVGNASPLVATSSAASASGADGTITAGNMFDNQMLAGAMYDFGIVKGYAQYVNRAIKTNSVETLNRTAYQLGARGNVTKTIEAWGSAGMGSYKTAADVASNEFFGYQVGSNYILSKRTNLYGIFGYTQAGASRVNGVPGGAQSYNYAAGVRHTF